MKILLTFTGFHDPYCASVIDGAQQGGPILSMLEARSIDVIMLFNTPGATKHTEATLEALRKSYPNISLDVKELPNLADPTDHIQILRYLRNHTRNILSDYPEGEFFISIASGTPSMHACWLLLVAEGTLPARILYGHPPRTAEESYVVSEVNISTDEFPEIRPKNYHPSPDAVEYVPELPSVCRELQIVGDDQHFVEALDRSAKLAQYDCHIMVLGETGTGKEHIARLIHRMSRRRTGPFVTLNCAAMPKELAESILFGHEKGAFTGASQRQEGEFANADKGTLFLDEIGDLPMAIQAKLLRVLQDGMIRSLGSGKDRHVDVRVVAATNTDLAKAIAEGQFRSDLAQRFIDTVALPPLRRRRGDIVKLATFALSTWNRKYGQEKTIARDALERLQTYAWPGNVRELISAVQRSAMMLKGKVIRAEDLRLGEVSWQAGATVSSFPEPSDGFQLKAYLAETREHLISRAIELSGGNCASAARLLGISTQAVHKYASDKDAP
ncbi:MAG: sigma-54 dependent transcriptional regulator [Kiritimatiellae bacterium]|nr:sigma-54 dependent transcriptional regulator [Kiritimatiellia bacterium]